MKLAAILSEYDKQVVQDSFQLRTYITNKLIFLSDSGDPKTELRALELLGKTSDVGLFIDKSEVTVVHTSSSVLGETLKNKIQNILSRKYAVVEEAVFEEVPREPITLYAADEDDEDEDEDEDSEGVC
tara:strand:- start:3869 stop:4252 length:384 start_codon:yes stop_codon:yes gene_type:complete